ncbi:hypothetical protein [Pseudomonas aeruginosa]|nr:hypothetical protein [Pseudomonas aeruginosa]
MKKDPHAAGLMIECREKPADGAFTLNQFELSNLHKQKAQRYGWA